MPAAGDVIFPHLDVPGADASTAVACALLDPDDRTADLPVQPDTAARTGWTGQPLRLAEPGEWRLTWTVTGAGAIVRTEVFVVDPDPDAIPDGFSFATTGDLVRYSGQPLPPGARRQLIDASREIERITKTARYAISSIDGRPENPRIRRAMAEATCELVGWWAETGTATGARALFTSASIAGVSLGFGGQASTNPQADRVGPRVWSILLDAGLVGGGGVFYG